MSFRPLCRHREGSLSRKLNSANSTLRYRNSAGIYKRRPFWLPASNYYILASAICIAFFFLVWGILHDGGDNAPWTTAGVGASVLLAGAVFLREVILRNARNRFIAEERLDKTLRKGLARATDAPGHPKLSLEQNAAMLLAIRKKSDAAKLFAGIAQGHREVFEICNQYLATNAAELRTVGAQSPRLPALLKGKDVAEKFHRFHMLRWAEVESQSLSQEARTTVKFRDKLETLNKALSVIETARQFYPDEQDLIDSEIVLREFSISVKVSASIEQAERAAFKGNYKRAESLYKDALFILGRDEIDNSEHQLAAEKISGEIERIRKLAAGE